MYGLPYLIDGSCRYMTLKEFQVLGIKDSYHANELPTNDYGIKLLLANVQTSLKKDQAMFLWSEESQTLFLINTKARIQGTVAPKPPADLQKSVQEYFQTNSLQANVRKVKENKIQKNRIYEDIL